ncbi:hypothetical protein CROQUDRAFT_91291 [Cronartium quercuum f. sp. fusiforme G11]|uniref:Uncharacterized protein n=1 Tax=Cronartium quercuum f. sp. fusiforme G11 TaxID=708437 RepID=A0A9P6NIH1_9BASI|nr:hypothetical protein CROQUDRAFT_91291 [Cronartium quercuum f. sp. fusiforme G11]
MHEKDDAKNGVVVLRLGVDRLGESSGGPSPVDRHRQVGGTTRPYELWLYAIIGPTDTLKLRSRKPLSCSNPSRSRYDSTPEITRVTLENFDHQIYIVPAAGYPITSAPKRQTRFMNERDPQLPVPPSPREAFVFVRGDFSIPSRRSHANSLEMRKSYGLDQPVEEQAISTESNVEEAYF